jgi:hypothetical protein
VFNDKKYIFALAFRSLAIPIEHCQPAAELHAISNSEPRPTRTPVRDGVIWVQGQRGANKEAATFIEGVTLNHEKQRRIFPSLEITGAQAIEWSHLECEVAD